MRTRILEVQEDKLALEKRELYYYTPGSPRGQVGLPERYKEGIYTTTDMFVFIDIT